MKSPKSKTRLKRAHILPLIVLGVVALLAAALFGGWYLLPSHPLDIAVLDKTVPASAADADDPVLGYRKHYGLFWMLNQRKITNPLTGRAYDAAADYYGTLLQEGTDPVNNSMARLNRTPDMVYLADAYGGETDGETAGDKGLCYADLAAAATAYHNGATLVAETDLFADATEEAVQTEFCGLLGITSTGWTGRYITDMSDLSDVPEWAQSLHESQYGRPWDYQGAGILLVSGQGELVILEKGSDFDGDMLTVAVADGYRKEFGRHSLNYYGWFELTEANYDTEVIAEYRFGLNGLGREKFRKIADKTVFPAVTRVKDERSPAYYFSGDFNDYVARARFPRFLFAEAFYRTFSYDREGDITNFYWNFYYPLMKTILKQTEENRPNVVQPEANAAASFRITDNRFERLENGEWVSFTLKGFNIQGVMPGSQPGEHTRDSTVYREYLGGIAEMGGNCVRVYDRMPPEFYRALSEHNRSDPAHPLCFLQSIVPPDTVNGAEALGEAPLEELRRAAAQTVDAVHGKATVPSADGESLEYIVDASAYLIGYLVEPDLSSSTVAALNKAYPGYTYAGEYVSSSGNAAEGLSALLCDHVYQYQQERYGYVSPVGAAGSAALYPAVRWHEGEVSFDTDRLEASAKTGGSFFVAYSLQPQDTALLGNTAAFADYTDSAGSFPYGGYVRDFRAAQTAHPLLIDRFGLSTNTNAFEKETSVNGLSETEQGEGLVRMLKAIQAEDVLGGLISDYDDNWSACSEELEPYTLPYKDNPLWQNALDAAQNTGVLAVEPKKSGDIALSLKDNDRLQELQVSYDAAYIYLTVMLDREVDYDAEQLFLGLDTYQRNNGEYLYDPAYFATSLSGMEYVVKFESKNTAAIYVVPSYNRHNGGYASKESYTGAFDYIAQLTYGAFDTAGTNFYQTGSTIHLRLPWSLLNVTDPSRMTVISDERPAEEIAGDAFGLQTTGTDGFLFSLLIADKETKDSLYLFPLDKQASGYKTFRWSTWEAVSYTLRQKSSCKILARYFSGL